MRSGEKLVMTPVEVAKALGIGSTATYQLLREGRIPCLRLGRCGKDGKGKFIIPTALFERWLQAEQDRALKNCRPIEEKDRG